MPKPSPGISFPALGFHPWQIEAHKLEDTLDAIDREVERCVALGEVGLDFKAKIEKVLQIRAFQSILEIATKRNEPIIIHARGAWEEALSMVVEAGLKVVIAQTLFGHIGP